MQEKRIEQPNTESQEQTITDLEMEYLQATADLTPWMIHLRLNGDGRYIYRVSGLLPNEDPNVFFDIDSFLLPIEESEPILLNEDSVPVQEMNIWNYTSKHKSPSNKNNNDISFYFWNKTAYSIHFPLKWAIQASYIQSFGPKVCAICEKYGFQDGIFLGYCADCAEKCRKQENISLALDVSL